MDTMVLNDNSIVIHTSQTKLVWEQITETLNPVYHFAFNIPSNKIEDAFTWLKKRTALLWLDDYNGYVADFVNWHAKSVYFLDPAGNIVELIARFDLPDHSDEAFYPGLIRCISEIGLVFPPDSFDHDVNKLMEDHNLSYFSKQPPLPHFRAIGNDEGLFVIVPEHRIWFSTKDKPAGIYPIRLKFEENGIVRDLQSYIPFI